MVSNFLADVECLISTSDGSETGVDLVVDATVSLLDLEGSLVTPGVVPGVDGEPVVLTGLGSPADKLNGVTSESGASGVLVDTGLVGWEVLVDSEGGGDGTVVEDVLLDLVDTSDSVGRGSVVLVTGVVNRRVGLAGGLALWGNLGHSIARWPM